MRALFNTRGRSATKVVERYGADERGRETRGRLVAYVESRRGRQRVGKVIADISISLDGFSTGPNVSMDNPMGDGGEGLHTWMFANGGPTGRDGAIVEGPQGLIASSGAVVVGRRMFDLGEEPWGDPPPFHNNPVLVVTHRPHPPIAKQGGTTYTFLTDGLEAALARARADAGDRNVAVLGGAEIIQQGIRGGLLDELRLHVVHIVLGGGAALFGGLDPADVALERIMLIDADGVTHLTFRLARKGPLS